MRRTIPVLLLTLVAAVGCNGDQGGDARDGATSAGPSTSGTTTGSIDPEALDPLQVLLGVVVLTAGDVDAAVAEGLVSPAELDAARSALADGDVMLWFEQARDASTP